MEATSEDIEVAAPEAPKSSKLPLLAVILGGLAVGGGVGVFVAGPAIAAKFFHTAAASDTTTAKAGGDHKPGKDGKAGGDSRVLHSIDNLVLNPAGSGGTRFLMVNATFELKDASVIDAIKSRDAEVRDALLSVLGHQTVEELTDMTHREKIKLDVIATLAPLFPAGAFKRVYFSQFVIQ